MFLDLHRTVFTFLSWLDLLGVALAFWISIPSKNEKGIQGEKSSQDTTSSRNLVSTIGAQSSPKKKDGTRCPYTGC